MSGRFRASCAHGCAGKRRCAAALHHAYIHISEQHTCACHMQPTRPHMLTAYQCQAGLDQLPQLLAVPGHRWVAAPQDLQDQSALGGVRLHKRHTQHESTTGCTCQAVAESMNEMSLSQYVLIKGRWPAISSWPIPAPSKLVHPQAKRLPGCRHQKDVSQCTTRTALHPMPRHHSSADQNKVAEACGAGLVGLLMSMRSAALPRPVWPRCEGPIQIVLHASCHRASCLIVGLVFAQLWTEVVGRANHRARKVCLCG